MNEYTFKLTEDQTNIILNALSTRPYIEVFSVISEIQKQASEQSK